MSQKATDAKLNTPTRADDKDGVLKALVAGNLKDMTPEQAADALRKISMLSPEQLNGQSLDGLPPAIQALIKGATVENADVKGNTNDKANEKKATPGQLTTDEQGVPTKIIILPQPVIDQFRSEDGIASIPENQSWQAKGNPTVRLPLPGGGDIKSVEDLKKFGFAP